MRHGLEPGKSPSLAATRSPTHRSCLCRRRRKTRDSGQPVPAPLAKLDLGLANMEAPESTWLGTVLARSSTSLPCHKAGCTLGPGLRWRGAGPTGGRGSGVQAACPEPQHGARGACTAQSRLRRPFLPEVGACGLWGHWEGERERETGKHVGVSTEKAGTAGPPVSTRPRLLLAWHGPGPNKASHVPEPRARPRPPRPLASYRAARQAPGWADSLGPRPGQDLFL